jgi:glycosyltransferase involved in cell wall biosynthesis
MADGTTGVLVADEEEFCQAARALLLNSQRRAEMGVAAAAYAQQFTWARTGEAFAQVVADRLPAAEPTVPADQRLP